MKTKLEMAHEFAMLHMINPQYKDVDDLEMVKWAWGYADAMQAEADERKKAEAEQKRKEMREMLNAQNTFVEREGQHFDDVEEWNPDWSQAPEWAKWWAMDADKRCYWFARKPTLESACWFPDDCSRADSATSFNYKGNWQDSLRERPYGF